MSKVVATGAQFFDTIRANDSFYVDKTGFIQEWWDNQDDVTLITRPRRFGKTLNMSMMNCFFSDRYAGRSDLFEGLQVWEDQRFHDLQGRFPVLFISFAGVKQASFDLARKSINQIIANLYNSYTEIFLDPWFTEMDARFISQIASDMPDDVAAVSLQKLCELLYRYYGKKVLIFLDEYDTPLQEAYIHGYWNELVSFVRALFNNTFKTNPSLGRAILTGITRVSKESIFSDMNNLEVITTTSEKYATCFGFTEQEVFQALEDQGCGEAEKQAVKTWYDGFTFGSVTDIYNPWSVTNYLDKRLLETYWANTSENALVNNLIRQGNARLKTQFETLLEGGALTLPLDEQVIFEQLHQRENAIWSLLLAAGYLKVLSVDRQRDLNPKKKNLYTLTLTNQEVQIMFDDMVQGWFEEGQYFNEFVAAMFRGNELDMNRYMNRIALKTFSYFDAGEKPGESEPERFYHGFVLGLLVDQAEGYELTSNRESGFGRYDVVMTPKRHSDPAVIMEFKVIDPELGEKSLEETAQNALKQIEEKKYDTELLAKGIAKDNILKYGFAFKGKECLIRKG